MIKYDRRQKMKILYDISRHTYDFFEFENVPYSEPTIKLGFRSNGELPVEFTNLSGGISVFDNEEKIFSFSFPEENINYISTDQDYVWLFSIIGMVVPDKEYILEAYVENADHEEYFVHTFTVDRPPKIHQGWIWDNDIFAWVSPIPYPQDGKAYIWNDDTENWHLKQTP